MKEKVRELQPEIHNRSGNGGKVHLMFQNEAGFGRINKPKYCWCEKGTRPSVPCHHIREYRYAYGAMEPLTGESCFLIIPYCNTVCMSLFLRELSNQFPDDIVLLCCDGAAWHKSKMLDVPENIVLFYIPPYTPERNPINRFGKKSGNWALKMRSLLPWTRLSIVSVLLFAPSCRRLSLTLLADLRFLMLLSVISIRVCLKT